MGVPNISRPARVSGSFFTNDKAKFKKLLNGQDHVYQAHDEISKLAATKRFQSGLLDNKSTLFLDRMRRFSVENPVADKVLCASAILGLSVALGLVSGVLINKLAHLTERKNDIAGKVVGVCVGLITLLSYGGKSLAVYRRADVASGLRAFSANDNTPQGFSNQHIKEISPVFVHTMIANSEAVKSTPVQHLVSDADDIRKQLTVIGLERESKERSMRYLSVSDSEPTHGAYFRSKINVDDTIIQKDKYYQARFSTFNAILEHDAKLPKDWGVKLFDDAWKELRSENFVTAHPSDEFPITTKVDDSRVIKTLDGIEDKITARFLAYFLRDSKNQASMLENTATLKAMLKSSTLGDNATQFFDLNGHKHGEQYISFVEQANDWAKKNHLIPSSWARIDEARMAHWSLEDLSPFTTANFLETLGNGMLFGLGSIADPSNQARNAFTSAGAYVPMSLAISTITVLGCGISSTPLPPSPPITEAGKSSKKGGAQPQQQQADSSPMPAAFVPLSTEGTAGLNNLVQTANAHALLQKGSNANQSQLSGIPAYGQMSVYQLPSMVA